jgi:hypothetical protein
VVLATPLKLTFKYCFHPVNLADTKKLLPPLETLEVVIVAFQILFLAAKTGVVNDNHKTGITTNINTKAFLFIKNIITSIMTLKYILLVVIVLAVLVGGTATYLVSKQNQIAEDTSTERFQTVPSSILPSPTSVTLSTWIDEAGFSFQYPRDITIDKHTEDTTNYANLTLTNTSTTDNITVLMTDNIYKTLDKWIASDSKLKSGTILDTTLGGKNGKKILTTNGTIIGVIDNDVLVTLKRSTNLSPLLETSWGKIIETWEFVYPTPTIGTAKTTKTISDDTGNVLEEE